MYDVILIGVVLVGWLIPAILLQRIAKKAGMENVWLAWLPIANGVLACRMGGLPSWFLLLAFIPCVGLVFTFVILFKMPKCLGIDGMERLFMLMPVFSLFYLIYLAYAYEPDSGPDRGSL